MRLEEEDFHKISLEDKPVFDRIYRKYPINHSENTFATLFCWRHYGNYSISEQEDCLIIKGETELYCSYRAPIGPMNNEVLNATIELAISSGEEAPFLALEPWQIEWIRRVRPDLVLKKDNDFADYVYLTESLATLPGKDYLMIRKQLNRFRKKCPSTVQVINDASMDEIGDFLIKWCQLKECDKYTILKHEMEAIKEAVNNFHEIGLSGISVSPRGEIGGIAIFEELNPDTAVIHYEKGLPNCEGIYKEINLQTALYLKNRYAYINRESDMGVPGLKESKERYHPHHMVPLYYLEIEKKGLTGKIVNQI